MNVHILDMNMMGNIWSAYAGYQYDESIWSIFGYQDDESIWSAYIYWISIWNDEKI